MKCKYFFCSKRCSKCKTNSKSEDDCKKPNYIFFDIEGYLRTKSVKNKKIIIKILESFEDNKNNIFVLNTKE